MDPATLLLVAAAASAVGYSAMRSNAERQHGRKPGRRLLRDQSPIGSFPQGAPPVPAYAHAPAQGKPAERIFDIHPRPIAMDARVKSQVPLDTGVKGGFRHTCRTDDECTDFTRCNSNGICVPVVQEVELWTRDQVQGRGRTGEEPGTTVVVSSKRS